MIYAVFTTRHHRNECIIHMITCGFSILTELLKMNGHSVVLHDPKQPLIRSPVGSNDQQSSHGKNIRFSGPLVVLVSPLIVPEAAPCFSQLD